MSAAPGRWRLRIDVHLDVAAAEDIDEVVRATAVAIEAALKERKAVAGRFNMAHHDACPKRDPRR